MGASLWLIRLHTRLGLGRIRVERAALRSSVGSILILVEGETCLKIWGASEDQDAAVKIEVL